MTSKVALIPILGLFGTSAVWCQNPPANHSNVPIYRITVIARTVKAVDYRYRGGPTLVDFRGTVLLPKAKGDALVESKAGRTQIDAQLQHVEPPTRFGAEYLTYVLWAITPEGHAKSLGELMPGSSDHAKLHVTTDLQAFGMIVTAEPYSAVRQPSDVVVMENEIRPDTIGRVEQVQARYELLPRGQYTYDSASALQAAATQGEMLPMDRYESRLEVYQAQNAVQIARSAGADRYAPDIYSKADGLLRTARQYERQRADRSTIVTAARQSAQTAEDARIVTERRKQDEHLAQTEERASKVEEQLSKERELRARAEADAQVARDQSSADRLQAEQEREQQTRAEKQVAAIAAATPPLPPIQTAPSVSQESLKNDLRVRMLQDLNAARPTLDTPRGLVVTLPEADFHGASLNPAVYGSLLRIAAAVSAHPGLYVEVVGHTDNSESESREEQISFARASTVMRELTRAGVEPNSISARGEGGNRPVASNATALGRAQNRRVEIVIGGAPIGNMPSWDKLHSLIPLR